MNEFAPLSQREQMLCSVAIDAFAEVELERRRLEMLAALVIEYCQGEEERIGDDLARSEADPIVRLHNVARRVVTMDCPLVDVLQAGVGWDRDRPVVDVDLLACGHALTGATDRIGRRWPARRRCWKCAKGRPAHIPEEAVRRACGRSDLRDALDDAIRRAYCAPARQPVAGEDAEVVCVRATAAIINDPDRMRHLAGIQAAAWEVALLSVDDVEDNIGAEMSRMEDDMLEIRDALVDALGDEDAAIAINAESIVDRIKDLGVRGRAEPDHG